MKAMSGTTIYKCVRIIVTPASYNPESRKRAGRAVIPGREHCAINAFKWIENRV